MHSKPTTFLKDYVLLDPSVASFHSEPQTPKLEPMPICYGLFIVVDVKLYDPLLIFYVIIHPFLVNCA